MILWDGKHPEFNEYTVVLSGMLLVTTKTQVLEIREDEAVIVPANECVNYSSPDEGGAEYIAVCLPAFSSETARPDED